MGSYYNWNWGQLNLPDPTGGRATTLRGSSSSVSFAEVDWRIDPTHVKKHGPISGGPVTVAQSTWGTLPSHNWTTKTSGDHSFHIKVGFDAATHHNSYYVRLVADGAEIATTGPILGLGPLLPIGSGYRVVTLQGTVHIPAGKQLQVQVRCTAAYASQRAVRDSQATFSWTE